MSEDTLSYVYGTEHLCEKVCLIEGQVIKKTQK